MVLNLRIQAEALTTTLNKIFGDNITVESKVHQDDDESGFGTILARQLIELMEGEFSADSPSGLEGDLGKKISFSITIYSNERPAKDLHYENITSASQIKTLAITGNQYT